MYTRESLYPNGITDIIYRMPEYISAMGEMGEIDKIAFIEMLQEYVLLSLAGKKVDLLEMKQVTVRMINQLYLALYEIDPLSEDALLYGEEVLFAFFTELSHLSLYFFLVIDDEIPDEVFLFLYSMFAKSGCSVVSPYTVRGYEEVFVGSEENTKLPARFFEAVEDDVMYSLKNLSHTLYIEKDGTVSYIHKILDIVDTIKNGYQCVYRNKPFPYPHALWVHGNRKEMI